MSRVLRTRLSAAAGLAALMLVGLIATGSAASAATGTGHPASHPASAPAAVVTPMVSCSGSGCDGRDPEVTGCAASAVTVDSVTTSFGTFDLRFSRTCQTNWVRTNNFSGGASELGMDVEDIQRGIYILFDSSSPGAAGTHFGNMVFSPAQDCAEGHVFVNDLHRADLFSSTC